MMNKNFKKRTIIIFGIIFFSIIFFLIKYNEKTDDVIFTQESEAIITEDNANNENIEKYKDLIESFISNKNINSDYIGQIFFDSNLINLPFVQGESNDTYFRTDWTTMQYEVGGSIFADYRNIINDDQNLILYGHNYTVAQDPTITKFFSPLRVLMDENNYNDNKIINIFLGDKLLKYEIIYIYKVKVLEDNGIQYLDDNEPFYDTPNFTKEEFDDYIIKVKEREFYSTGKNIDYSDKMLTLQTCIDDVLDKLIINAKLIETIDISN